MLGENEVIVGMSGDPSTGEVVMTTESPSRKGTGAHSFYRDENGHWNHLMPNGTRMFFGSQASVDGIRLGASVLAALEWHEAEMKRLADDLIEELTQWGDAEPYIMMTGQTVQAKCHGMVETALARRLARLPGRIEKKPNS